MKRCLFLRHFFAALNQFPLTSELLTSTLSHLFSIFVWWRAFLYFSSTSSLQFSCCRFWIWARHDCAERGRFTWFLPDKVSHSVPHESSFRHEANRLCCSTDANLCSIQASPADASCPLSFPFLTSSNQLVGGIKCFNYNWKEAHLHWKARVWLLNLSDGDF